MTQSEQEFADFLQANKLPFIYDDNKCEGKNPDFGFSIHRQSIIAEVKECGPKWPDAYIIGGTSIGGYGSHEGKTKVRSSGRIGVDGWVGAAITAVGQVTPHAKLGKSTLIVLRPKSWFSEMDKPDVECFLFGHGCRIEGGEFVARECSWQDNSPPLLRFSDLSGVSAVAMFDPPSLDVYLNPFGAVPLNADAFSWLAGCENVFTMGHIPGHSVAPSFVPYDNPGYNHPTTARLERMQLESTVQWPSPNSPKPIDSQ